MKRNDLVYLAHILDAINQLETYTADFSYDMFWQNRLVQDGVVRQLEIIGEASRNLSEVFRTEHPQLPWSQIISLRNRLTHAYFDINLGYLLNNSGWRRGEATRIEGSWSKQTMLRVASSLLFEMIQSGHCLGHHKKRYSSDKTAYHSLASRTVTPISYNIDLVTVVQ